LRKLKQLKELEIQKLSDFPDYQTKDDSSRTENPMVNSYLDSIYAMDYHERPATMKELLCSPKFFGSLTRRGKAVYPGWFDILEAIRNEPMRYNVVLTGSIGYGKSRAAVWGIASVIQRLLCLKDPWEFLNIAEGGKLNIVFFNLKRSMASSLGFGLLHQHLLASPWFRARGIPHDNLKVPWLEFPFIDFLLGSPYSKGFGSLGHDVVAAVMDEVDSPNESAGMREKILSAYDLTIRRHQSRFVSEYGETIGKFFLVASKQDKLSFLNTFVESRKHSPNMMLIDKPIWEIKTDLNFSGVMFKVMLGDKFTNPRIVTDTAEIEDWMAKGFEVIDVPDRYLTEFQEDIVGAIKDIAGKALESRGASKLFPTTRTLLKCYDKEKRDPCSKMTIEIGMMDQGISIMDFIDLNKIRQSPAKERFIHCDIAYSGGGDSLGLAMSCVSHWEKRRVMTQTGAYSETPMPVIELDFVIRIRAPKDDEIPLYKIREFVIDLYQSGYNIKLFTADLRAMSVEMRQLLETAGIPTDYLSMDKTADNYTMFRDIVNEYRFRSHHHPYLHFELENLEFDRLLNKVDHPKQVESTVLSSEGSIKKRVLKGSKDLADAAGGSVVSAAKNSEYEDGEAIIDIISNVQEILNNDTRDRYDDFALGGQASDKDMSRLKFEGESARLGITNEKRHLQDSDGMYWLCYLDIDSDRYNFIGPHKYPLDPTTPEVITSILEYKPFRKKQIHGSESPEKVMLNLYSEILRKCMR